MILYEEPKPGDYVMHQDASWIVPEWRLARVVAVGKVMWTVEAISIDWHTGEVRFSGPAKRKIQNWKLVKGDPAQMAIRLRELRDAMLEARKKAADYYAATCIAFAEENR